MLHSLSVSIDVPDLERAVTFYVEALSCRLKRTISENWAVLAAGEVEIHLLEKREKTIAAADQRRSYERHWTPVHLDFVVSDVDLASAQIANFGGTVEAVHKGDLADIAHCADPFGNGFCLIREPT